MYNYIKISKYKDTSRKIHFLDQKIILHSINWAAKASLEIAHRLMSRRKMATVFFSRRLLKKEKVMS